MSPALRHRGFACRHTPAPGAWAAPRCIIVPVGLQTGEQPDRWHAQTPVTLVDTGQGYSVRASNSQVPPAASMPPAGCGAAPANPSGPSAAYATAGTRPAIARHGEPWLHHRRAKPAGARDGPPPRRRIPPGLRRLTRRPARGRPSLGMVNLGFTIAGPSPRGPGMAPRALNSDLPVVARVEFRCLATHAELRLFQHHRRVRVDRPREPHARTDH